MKQRWEKRSWDHRIDFILVSVCERTLVIILVTLEIYSNNRSNSCEKHVIDHVHSRSASSKRDKDSGGMDLNNTYLRMWQTRRSFSSPKVFIDGPFRVKRCIDVALLSFFKWNSSLCYLHLASSQFSVTWNSLVIPLILRERRTICNARMTQRRTPAVLCSIESMVKAYRYAPVQGWKYSSAYPIKKTCRSLTKEKMSLPVNLFYLNNVLVLFQFRTSWKKRNVAINLSINTDYFTHFSSFGSLSQEMENSPFNRARGNRLSFDRLEER